MEDFSTPHRFLVPTVTNVMTLAVLVAALVWSADQRPGADNQRFSKTQATPAAAPAPAQLSGWNPGKSTPVVSLQPVGYTPIAK